MAGISADRKLREQLIKLDRERSEVKFELDRARLVQMTGSVIEAITSPAFIERMRQAREKANEGRGLDVMGDLLSLESLRFAGAEIPEDFRLTSRVFEDKAGGIRITVDEDVDIEPGLGGVVGCCGGGGFGACACCGGCEYAPFAAA